MLRDLTRLERSILRAIVRGPHAWIRVRTLISKVRRAHPESIRRSIGELVKSGLLAEWRLAKGDAVTLTQIAADRFGELAGLGCHVAYEIYEKGLVERPRWRRKRRQTRRGVCAYARTRPIKLHWLDGLQLPAAMLAQRLKFNGTANGPEERVGDER